MKKKPTMKRKDFFEDCQKLYDMFDVEDMPCATDFLARLTNDPYWDKVNTSLSKGLEDACGNCWNRITSVSFVYGLVIGSALNPNSNESFSVLREMKEKMLKAGVLPLK